MKKVYILGFLLFFASFAMGQQARKQNNTPKSSSQIKASILDNVLGNVEPDADCKAKMDYACKHTPGCEAWVKKKKTKHPDFKLLSYRVRRDDMGGGWESQTVTFSYKKEPSSIKRSKKFKEKYSFDYIPTGCGQKPLPDVFVIRQEDSWDGLSDALGAERYRDEEKFDLDAHPLSRRNLYQKCVVKVCDAGKSASKCVSECVERVKQSKCAKWVDETLEELTE